MTGDKIALGNWVRINRENAGFSQDKLGKQIGIDRQQIYRIENGLSGTKPETIVAIARALEIDESNGLEFGGYLSPKQANFPKVLMDLDYNELSPTDLAEIQEIICVKIKYAKQRNSAVSKKSETTETLSEIYQTQNVSRAERKELTEVK